MGFFVFLWKINYRPFDTLIGHKDRKWSGFERFFQKIKTPFWDDSKEHVPDSRSQ
jgi:hypothetical protein